ncbi:ribose-5-phosphate isomerase RpiA [Kallotenue papyrolyticum]|uniref:ribose-5-phosphate isomerase RpiA n=1 Tax=Kallotenue papyrolyticum TaxID=1325125 RepID=UPI000478653E|nr:ribose-5-phosphate isomerase RpiA [Kallotenue papyrolyticum]
MSDLTPKQHVALAAAQVVRSGMRLGLGSGSTVGLIVEALGERVQRGELRDLRVVVASRWTETKALAAGLTVVELNDVVQLDLAIDGADEVDPQRAMIKGGGGALLRERIVLYAARERLIAVDESKLVPHLGASWALPVEVVQFGWRVAEAALRALGTTPQLRRDGMQPFVTDEGNYILDCPFRLRAPQAQPGAAQGHDPHELDRALRAIPGVMDHGLFLGLADRVLVGQADGVREL